MSGAQGVGRSDWKQHLSSGLWPGGDSVNEIAVLLNLIYESSVGLPIWR